MSLQCRKCSGALPPTGEFASCKFCGSSYHFSSCTSVAEQTYARMSAEKKLEWKCQHCRNKAKPSSSTSTGGGGSSAQSEVREGKKRHRSESFADTGTTMRTENCKSEMKEIKSMIEKLANKITSSQDAIRKEMNAVYTNINETLKAMSVHVDELTKKGIEKDKRIDHLERKINYLEQSSLENNVEIVNVPQKEHLSAFNAAKEIAKVLGTNFSESDIADAYYPSKRNNKIIVKLSSKAAKNELLKKAKEIKINAEQVRDEYKGEKKTIYINDQLTYVNNRLFWLAKNRGRQQGWKFIWVQGGRILSKKEETSKIFQITCENDIDSIFTAAP